jgi:TonB family protein
MKGLLAVAGRCVVLAICLFTFTEFAYSQNFYFSYRFSFEPSEATHPPEIGPLNINLPEAARKNGVEGTAKASMTLGEDGKMRDITIVQDLPDGVGNAMKASLEKHTFTPARANGTPVPVKATLEYVIEVVYSEGDKAVNKPRITSPLIAPYPVEHQAQRPKGDVEVFALFQADGVVKVQSVKSFMHKEFDAAARAAAEKLQFQPATHKKSKRPVSQAMTVVFVFK